MQLTQIGTQLEYNKGNKIWHNTILLQAAFPDTTAIASRIVIGEIYIPYMLGHDIFAKLNNGQYGCKSIANKVK